MSERVNPIPSELESKGYMQATGNLLGSTVGTELSDNGPGPLSHLLIHDLWVKTLVCLKNDLTEDQRKDVPKHELEVIVMTRFVNPKTRRAFYEAAIAKEERRDRQEREEKERTKNWETTSKMDPKPPFETQGTARKTVEERVFRRIREAMRGEFDVAHFDNLGVALLNPNKTYRNSHYVLDDILAVLERDDSAENLATAFRICDTELEVLLKERKIVSC